ncbi:MAG TPA: hypothetical protein VFR56_11470, partial [Actinomycetes bacterium]|nr:hypothetical protein [Actinomycetes bacterium]
LRSLTLSRRHVDTRTHTRKVRVTVRAADANAGVRSVSVQAFRTGTGTVKVALHRVSGTPRSGTWLGQLVLPRWTGTGTWRVRARVFDRVENGLTVTPRTLASRGLPSTIRVTSRTDTTRPTISDVRVAPLTVDARTSDAFVRVWARVRDSGSGVRTVSTSAALVDGDVFTTRLHRVSGTRRDGRWTGRVTIPRCQSDDEIVLSGSTEGLPFHVAASDRAGNFRGQSPQQRNIVTAQFRDNDTPYWTAALPASTGQLEVWIQEPVVGNGSWNPLVAEHETGAEVAGVWTCSDASGAPVGCANDPLTRAVFTPAVPLGSSATYDVTLNREHTLHVVDLAGNPLLGTQTAVRVQR